MILMLKGKKPETEVERDVQWYIRGGHYRSNKFTYQTV